MMVNINNSLGEIKKKNWFKGCFKTNKKLYACWNWKDISVSCVENKKFPFSIYPNKTTDYVKENCKSHNNLNLAKSVK